MLCFVLYFVDFKCVSYGEGAVLCTPSGIKQRCYAIFYCIFNECLFYKDVGIFVLLYIYVVYKICYNQCGLL